ncbi:MAG: hypothetical protein Q8868_14000 [Bacteroidota bacterium]|nr:hypothetical protein [Bacteroidota bacterium]
MLLLTFLCLSIFHDLPAISQISDRDTSAQIQLQEFQNRVNRDRIAAQRWWYGWLAGYSAATAGQGVVYFSTDEKTTRQDMALGAATTLLGAIGVLITPIVPWKSSFEKNDITEGDLSQLNSGINKDAELLKEIARREKEGRSWKMHAITGVVNVGSGLIEWLGFDRSIGDGLINFAINTVITEAQIWTQPVKAIKDYRKFSGSDLSRANSGCLKPEKKLYLGGTPAGFVLRYDF